MPKIFRFNNIVKGQQLIIFFIDDKTLVFKRESISQGTRVVVFGETLEGEKVLIPAFTTAELDDKYSYVDDKSQRTNNCIDWKSKTRFGITSRLLDVEEIYLLNAKGHLRKYDGAFDGIVCSQRSNFYVSNEATYNFEDLKLFSLKTKFSNILFKNSRRILPMTENVSLIAQATEKIGVSSTASSTELLTMAEKVKLFIQKINQLYQVINVSAYSQETNINVDDITSLISRTELLNNLNIKTGSIFTKEELAKFKIKLEDIKIGDQTNIFHIKLNFMHKIDDNSWI